MFLNNSISVDDITQINNNEPSTRSRKYLQHMMNTATPSSSLSTMISHNHAIENMHNDYNLRSELKKSNKFYPVKNPPIQIYNGTDII